VGNDKQFGLLCTHLGVPGLAQDTRYATPGQRSVNRAALRDELVAHFAALDGNALAEGLMDRGVPCAPVLSVDAALKHPHTAHREMVVKIGDYTGVASPIKLGRTPATYRLAPPVE
jgi:crotonobetainyl-CoA:carnitine CoA-transferase CaiB-like acyl-CoA transferase